VWCDTPDAFVGGVNMSVDEVMARVRELGVDMVELTGGEPLLQKELPTLAQALLDAGATVLCETGGHRDISVLPPGVIRIMDLKCPGSGEGSKNLWSNIGHLNVRDEVKFVVADRADFDWSVAAIREHRLEGKVAALLFSPVHGACDPRDLVDWILEAKVKGGQFNLQLHKVIWGAEAKGV